MRFAGVGQKYTQLGFRYYRGKNISVILFLTKIYIFIAISWKTEVHDPQNRRSWQLCGIINKMAKFKVNTFCEFAFSIYISSPKLSLIWKYRHTQQVGTSQPSTNRIERNFLVFENMKFIKFKMMKKQYQIFKPTIL